MPADESRRKSRRYRVSWPTRLLLKSKKILSVKTRDVSSGGVSFESEHRFFAGDPLGIELSPWVSGKKYVIRASGLVTFNMILSDGDGFSHGFKFTSISKAHYDELVEILKYFDNG